ncbi:uncharacterized protein LOC127374000 [Dicentrarchus labrax]|uniref:uncharacterized protein LOC127374000 n=1 Tax=Dicentrarchus labrax TaxID=13489 RepID=UPI0021F64ADA|nr:uncharacterized protein LOC127374000 [Dicentrarchus labrax]
MFKMMECRGDRKTSATRSTNTDSVHSARPCNEGRAAALRYVAKTLLNEREREGEEEEDLCSDFLSSFINTLEDRQWESIRERMRQPLTQTHLARVSRRIIRVVSELVFQLLVPALMDRLQAEDDFPVASRGSSKSCKLHGSHSEEETQSTDSRPTSHSDTPLNRSSPVMVRPFIEDPVQKSSGVNEESLAKSLGRSISQSSARSMPGKVEQQVNQSPTGLGACTPPLESHAEVCADQAQEQVAEVTSVTGKALSFVDGGFAEVELWQDVEQFLVPATEEVISAIIKSMDVCQEKIEAGAETEKTATKILKHLAIKMRSSEFTEEETQNRYLDQFDLESLEDFEKDFFCNFTHLHEKLQCSISKVRTAFKNRERDGKTLQTNPEVREGSPLQGMMITYPMTVCSQDVVKDLSCRRFRHTSLKELKEFLMRSVQTFFSQNFGAMAPSLELCMASVDSVASEMLDVVVNSVNQTVPATANGIYPSLATV